MFIWPITLLRLTIWAKTDNTIWFNIFDKVIKLAEEQEAESKM